MYRTVTALFSDARIRSGLAWNLTATIAGRSAGLALSIILARVLGQAAFGEFSIIQSTILTFGVFAGFGAGLTATKYIAESVRADSARSGRVLALVLVLACAFGGVMTAALFVVAPLIADRLFAVSHLTSFLRIASFSLIASALSGAQSGALAGFEEFQGLSKVNLYSGLVSIVTVAVGVASWGMTGALWGYNIAVVISCHLGARALSKATANHGVTPDYWNCMREWPVLWRFSLPTMLANALVTPAVWLCNAMLVNQPNGLSEMAVYNVATQWRQLLLFLPGIAAQVFLPIMSSHAKGEGPGPAMAQFQKINMLIAAPFLICLAVLSPLILAIYGTTYISQWPVFVVVQLATFAQIIQAPVITSWAADGRMWTNLFANGVWGASLVLCSWALIGLGALGLGLALFASFVIYFIIILVEKRRDGDHGRFSE
jgi:O-antigen/teichoic acid export membrane protein